MSTVLSGTDRIGAVIDEMYDAGVVTADDGKRLCLRDFAVRRECGEVLAGAARAIAPRATIEVGCASGLSTLHMCRGRRAAGCLEPGSAHTIDLKQTTHWHNIGHRAIERAGLCEIVCLYEEAAHTVLPRLIDRLRIQFAFLDGWHMFDFVMVEAFYCDLMLDVGGVIALHDMFMPALRNFAAFWTTNRPYEPVRLAGGELVTGPPADAPDTGLDRYVDCNVLLLRKTGQDDRAWDDFCQFT